MYPAIIRGGVAMGVMPLLPDQGEGEGERWLPVDVCARAVGEIEGLVSSSSDNAHRARQAEVEGKEQKRILYNILPPATFSWSRDLLPTLSKLGLNFETLPFEDWLSKLRQLASSASRDEQHSSSATDPARNPALKLIDFFEEGLEGKGGGGDGEGGVRFATEAAMGMSPSLRDCGDVIGSGLLGKMVGVWMERWGEEGGGGDVGEGGVMGGG